MDKIKILFVCMGNICRSPTAEGVFRQLITDKKINHLFEIDSAGTIDYHAGSPPDLRSQKAAARRGIDISMLRARQVTINDFDYYDYILAMDRENYYQLLQLTPAKNVHKIKLFLSFAPHLEIEEVPDPYYGGANGFEYVLDIIEAGAQGLLAKLNNQLADRINNID